MRIVTDKNELKYILTILFLFNVLCEMWPVQLSDSNKTKQNKKAKQNTTKHNETYQNRNNRKLHTC